MKKMLRPRWIQANGCLITFKLLDIHKEEVTKLASSLTISDSHLLADGELPV